MGNSAATETLIGSVVGLSPDRTNLNKKKSQTDPSLKTRAKIPITTDHLHQTYRQERDAFPNGDPMALNEQGVRSRVEPHFSSVKKAGCFESFHWPELAILCCFASCHGEFVLV